MPVSAETRMRTDGRTRPTSPRCAAPLAGLPPGLSAEARAGARSPHPRPAATSSTWPCCAAPWQRCPRASRKAVRRSSAPS
jgi:hypothetical protein